MTSNTAVAVVPPDRNYAPRAPWYPPEKDLPPCIEEPATRPKYDPSSHCVDSLGSQMALVKSSKVAARTLKANPTPSPSEPRPLGNPPAPTQRSGTRTPEALFERVAAATEEFASGLTEASAAAEELRKSMEQIASGAEEAAGASQAQLAAIKRIFDGLRTARGEADALRRRTDNVQIMLGEAAERITVSGRAIERNAQRQAATVDI